MAQHRSMKSGRDDAQQGASVRHGLAVGLARWAAYLPALSWPDGGVPLAASVAVAHTVNLDDPLHNGHIHMVGHFLALPLVAAQPI